MSEWLRGFAVWWASTVLFILVSGFWGLAMIVNLVETVRLLSSVRWSAATPSIS